MGVLICPGCGVANSDSAGRCHCCARKFAVTHLTANAGVIADTLGYIAPEQRRNARIARRALLSAASMCALRALIMPWLITHDPTKTFAGMNAMVVQITSCLAAAAFFLCALWADSDPLAASLLCLSLYVGLSVPDLIHPTSFLASGILSKTVMLTIIGRAVIAGILHRLLQRDPVS